MSITRFTTYHRCKQQFYCLLDCHHLTITFATQPPNNDRHYPKATTITEQRRPLFNKGVLEMSNIIHPTYGHC